MEYNEALNRMYEYFDPREVDEIEEAILDQFEFEQDLEEEDELA